MKTDDPIFDGTTSLELWRHDDAEEDGCHVGLYYRSNGVKDLYEMRVGEYVIPLHPDFPLGFPLAAHCLLHICQSLYSGELVEKVGVEATYEDLSKLLDKWNLENDRESTTEGNDS